MSTRKKISQAMICEAGEKLFSQHGYSAVGIKMILDEVGIPKGSFYHYFKSKEAFAAEVAEQFFSKRLERFQNDFAKNNVSVQDIIISAYDAEIDEMFKDGEVRGCVLGNLFIEASNGQGLLQDKLKNIYQRWLSLFIQGVEAGQKLGEFRTDIDAERLASMFWSHWEGAVLKLQASSDKEQVKQEMRDFMLLIAAPAS